MSSKKVLFAYVSTSGFTLVELLVSISIMIAVATVTLSGVPQAIIRAALSDDAFHIELVLRQTQIEGSAINSLDNTYGGMGVFFTRATTSQVLTFKDSVDSSIIRAIGVGNGLYDTAPSDEQKTISLLSKRDYVAELCVATSSLEPFYCNDAVLGTIPVIQNLTVSFTRPQQTAHIYVNNNSGKDYVSACIQINALAAQGSSFSKSVVVYKSGLIIKKIGPCK